MRGGAEPARAPVLAAPLRYGLPALVLAGAGAVSLFALPALRAEDQSAVVAAAVTLDLTVVLPGLVYFLLVRSKRLPWIAIVPTFVVGYAVAMATLPEAHHGVLDAIRLLAIPAEIGLVAYLALLARKTFKRASRAEGDFATRFRFAARDALQARIPADILTTEVSILYHAFRWRRPPPDSEGSFTVHREANYLTVVIGLTMVLLVETVALHALVWLWSATAAWILTGLSLYAYIWLVGDYRAMTARPIRLTPTHLSMRMGVRWEAEIPLTQIASAEPLGAREEVPGSDTLVAALLGQPNLMVKLEEPVEVIGMYGWRRTVSGLRLRVDGAPELRAEIQRRIVPSEGNNARR